MKYVDFQKCIPVSRYKNINFDEVRWSRCFSRNVYLIHGYKNINFDEVRWFPEFVLFHGYPFWWSTLNSRNEYTCFTLWKYQFWWSTLISMYTWLKYVDFPEMYTWFRLYKYLFSWSTLISRNEYLFHGIKILILKKYVDFQKCIPVSGYKNIDFDEVVVFPEMYTWFKLYKYLFSWSTLISRNEYLFHAIKILILKKYQKCISQIQVIKIYILMKYVDFQKCIPVSAYKNINFDEVRWFPEMYTWFKLYKYLFSWSTLISRIVYLFQVIKISNLMKYVELQKWIPVSRDQNINFEEVRIFDEVVVFPEMYTWFKLYKYLFAWSTLISRNVYLFHGIKILILKKFVDIKNIYLFHVMKISILMNSLFSRNVYLIQVIQISILMKYGDFQKCIPVSWDQNINFEEVLWNQQIYTCFTLWKYQFWWSRCFSRNVYLIRVIQISIFIKYVDFQNCIHVSDYENIYFDDVRWIPEMNIFFTGSKY